MIESKHDESMGQKEITQDGFHYKQELQRTLRFFGSFSVAFSFISITTGIFTNYGFVLKTAGPVGIWSWPIAVIGQVLVALVIADLAGKIPVTGYSYQWVTRLTNPGLGWLAGWLSFAFLALVGPAVDGGLAPIVAGLFKLETTPTILKIITVSALTFQIFLNIRGVKWATVINNLAVFSEAVGMIGLLVLLAVASLFVDLDSSTSFSILFQTNGSNSGTFAGPFLLSMLMGLFTLVGFEAAANMSEETIDAEHTVPKAVVGSVLLSGVVGMLFLIFATFSIPNLADVLASDNPLPFIISTRLGSVVGTFFLILVIISIFACGLVITTSASRLVYALARDRVFFANEQLSKVVGADCVPANALVLIWLLGVVGILFSDSLTTLVGTTAVLPALIYLLTVLAYRFHNGQVITQRQAGWRLWVANIAIVWLVFCIGVLTIPPDFHLIGLLSAVIVGIGILLYFLIIRARIQSGKAGIWINS